MTLTLILKLIIILILILILELDSEKKRERMIKYFCADVVLGEPLRFYFLYFYISSLFIVYFSLLMTFPGYFSILLALCPSFSHPWRPPLALSSVSINSCCLFLSCLSIVSFTRSAINFKGFLPTGVFFTLHYFPTVGACTFATCFYQSFFGSQ